MIDFVQFDRSKISVFSKRTQIQLRNPSSLLGQFFAPREEAEIKKTDSLKQPMDTSDTLNQLLIKLISMLNVKKGVKGVQEVSGMEELSSNFVSPLGNLFHHR